MNKQLLEDMIEDLEQAKRLIERRLRALYAMNTGVHVDNANVPVISELTDKSNIGNSIKAEIDKRRQEIMSQIEQIRTQATEQVGTLKNSTPMTNGSSGLANMPNMLSGFRNGVPLNLKVLEEPYRIKQSDENE
jgi:hypothetical protein